jgi:starch synthase
LKPLPQPWPARMDPFHAFASYPTQTLTPQTVLALVDADSAIALARVGAYQKLAMVNFAKMVLPSEVEVQLVLNAAASGAKTALELIQAIPDKRQASVFRALVWLLKLGLLKVCS